MQLKKILLDLVGNSCNIKNNTRIQFKEVDIIIGNIGIEYNGAYWHKYPTLDKNYHKDKTNLCLKNGIKLLHVWDFNKLDIVESLLHSTRFKSYRGMASREAQEEWRGKSSAPEGIATMIPCKGSVENIFNDLVGNIKSGLSHSGVS